MNKKLKTYIYSVELITNNSGEYMKVLDVIAAVLLVIGGLNWGLVGAFDFNLVTYLFGSVMWLAKVIYLAVGLSALFQIFQWKAIQNRWKC